MTFHHLNDVPFKRTSFEKKFIGESTYLPHINLFIVIVISKLLRTKIARRSNKGSSRNIVVDRTTEISQFYKVLYRINLTPNAKIF